MDDRSRRGGGGVEARKTRRTGEANRREQGNQEGRHGWKVATDDTFWCRGTHDYRAGLRAGT